MDHSARARAYNRADDLLMLAVPLPPCGARPPGVETVVLDATAPVDLLRENLDVNERGFDPAAAPVTAEQAEAFRPELTDARAVTVRAGGQAVAAGMMLPVRDGVTELAGIATLAGHRRRGYGRIATEALMATAAGLGAELIVLSTGNPAARRLYERIGFVPVS